MKTTFFSKPDAAAQNPNAFSLCRCIRWLSLPVSIASYSLCSGGFNDSSPLDVPAILLRIVAFFAMQSILLIGLHLDNNSSLEERKKTFADIFLPTLLAFNFLIQALLIRLS